MRVRADKALACFIFSPKTGTIVSSNDDSANVVRTLSFKRVTHNQVRTHVQAMKPSSSVHFIAAGADVVVPVESIKMNLLAQSCLCPGMNTLVLNLVSSRDLPAITGTMLEWQQEFLEGASKEIYHVPIGEWCIGCSFNQIVLYMFILYEITLFGVESMDSSGQPCLYLNPGPSYIFKKGDNAVVIATDTKQALKMRDPIHENSGFSSLLSRFHRRVMPSHHDDHQHQGDTHIDMEMFALPPSSSSDTVRIIWEYDEDTQSYRCCLRLSSPGDHPQTSILSSSSGSSDPPNGAEEEEEEAMEDANDADIIIETPAPSPALGSSTSSLPPVLAPGDGVPLTPLHTTTSMLRQSEAGGGASPSRRDRNSKKKLHTSLLLRHSPLPTNAPITARKKVAGGSATNVVRAASARKDMSRTIDEAVVSHVDTSVVRNHIVVCGALDALEYFIEPLRADYLEHVTPIVVIHDHPPSQALWRTIGHYEHLYFIIGSSRDMSTLESAGIHVARQAIILSDKGHDSAYEDSPEPFMVDNNAIMTLLTIMACTDHDINTIVELINPHNISLIQDMSPSSLPVPKRRARLDPFSVVGKTELERQASFISPAFCAGHVHLTTSMNSSILAQSFFNPILVTIVQKLFQNDIMSKEVDQDRRGHTTNSQNFTYQVDVPASCIGLSYGAMFEKLVEAGIIPIALYRTEANGSPLPYVVTSPRHALLLQPGDKIFIPPHVRASKS
eukprot:TRINITY_DN5914_c0_g1_i3.p1 TRINITY_DN5914_c0_g1~~TRINITY_DN5914_c0_g1_i3.p1  ORF type:complete len:728 (+),score=183.80 TRINITY_DN5914_c0_g1_i3:246-2429(+)